MISTDHEMGYFLFCREVYETYFTVHNFHDWTENPYDIKLFHYVKDLALVAGPDKQCLLSLLDSNWVWSASNPA